MIAWLLFGGVILGFIALAWEDHAELARSRRAMRKVEDETERRLEREGELEGRADVGPDEVLHVLEQIADRPDVKAVFRQEDSNVLHVQAREWVTEMQLFQLKEAVRFSTPIGLSSRVVRTRAEIPADARLMAKSFFAVS